jgi:hypothetical protein
MPLTLEHKSKLTQALQQADTDGFSDEELDQLKQGALQKWGYDEATGAYKTAQPSPVSPVTPVSPQPARPSILSKIAGLAGQGQELLNPQALMEEQGPAIQAGSMLAAPGLHLALAGLGKLGVPGAEAVRRDIGPAAVQAAGGMAGFIPSTLLGQVKGRAEAAELSRTGHLGRAIGKGLETAVEPGVGLFRPYSELATPESRAQFGTEFKEAPLQKTLGLLTPWLMLLGPALHAKVTSKVKAAGDAVKAMEANPTPETIAKAKSTISTPEEMAQHKTEILDTVDPAVRPEVAVLVKDLEGKNGELKALVDKYESEAIHLREMNKPMPESEFIPQAKDLLRKQGFPPNIIDTATGKELLALIQDRTNPLPGGPNPLRPEWATRALDKGVNWENLAPPKAAVAPPEGNVIPFDTVQQLIDEKLKTWDSNTKQGFISAWEKKDWDAMGRMVPPYDLVPLEGKSTIDVFDRLAKEIKAEPPKPAEAPKAVAATGYQGFVQEPSPFGRELIAGAGNDLPVGTHQLGKPPPVAEAPGEGKVDLRPSFAKGLRGPEIDKAEAIAGKGTKGTKGTKPEAPDATAKAYGDVQEYWQKKYGEGSEEADAARSGMAEAWDKVNPERGTPYNLFRTAALNAVRDYWKRSGREISAEELGGAEAIEGGIIERVRGGKRPIVGEMLGAELEQPGITGSKSVELPKTPGIETAKAEWLHNQEGTAYAHSTNLNNMSMPETAWGDFLNIHNQFDQAFEANKIHRSLAEIKEQAKDLGMDEHFLNQWEGTTKDLDILANAAKKLQSDIAIDGSAKLQDPNLSHADKAMLVQRMANAFIKVDDMSSNYGRALSSLRNKFGEGEAVKSYMQAIIEQAKREGQYKGEKVLPKEVVNKIVSMMEDPDFNPSAIIPFTKNPTLWDKAYFCWLNGLVSAPSTHIVNLTSTGIMSTLELPVRAVAEGTAWFGSKAGSHVGPAALVPGEFVYEMMGRTRGTLEFVKSMGKAVPTGLEYFGGMASKYEQGMHPIKGRFGKVVGLPTKALSIEDMGFKSPAYYGEVYALAYRKAIGEGLKPFSKEAFTRAEEIFQRPTVDIVKAASDRALDVTFNSPVPKGIVKQLMAVRQQPTLAGKAAGIIFPFIRTPWNIAFKGIEYSPVNFGRILARQMGWMGEGKLTPAEFHMTMARAMVGTGIQLAVYQLAKQGLITGSGPTEKNKRDALYRTGWQPYSVKIGNKYYSYFRLEPFGTILGLAADFTELTQNMDEDEKNYVFDKIAMSIGRNLSSKTFLQGISNVVNVITDPSRYGENWIEQLAGSTVPATGLMNWASRTIDPNLREVHGILDAIKYRIPGVSKTLPARQDIWGEEIKKEGITKGIGGDIWRAVSPVQVSTAKEDEVESELSRLGYFPGKPSKNVGKEKLTPKQYYELIKNSGPQAKQSIIDKIRSPEYQNLSDSQKRNKFEGIISRIRTVAREPYRTNEGLTPKEIFDRKRKSFRLGTTVGK